MIYRQNLSETKGVEQGNIRKKSLQKYHLVHFLFVCQLLSMYSWLTVLNITCETALEKTNYSSICECQSQFFSFRAEILCPFPSPNLGILSVLTWFRLCASSLSLCEFICASVLLCVEESFGVVFVFGVIHPLWLLTVFLSSLLHSSLGPEGRVW